MKKAKILFLLAFLVSFSSMGQLIQLTVLSEDGNSVSSESRLFETSVMRNTKAHASGAVFYAPGSTGTMKEYIVSETLSTVVSLAAASSTNVNAKKVVVEFDATGGKAIGAYSATDAATGAAVTIPINARVSRGFYAVLTTFTSAGADAGTISAGLLVDDVAGIVAAIAISDGSNPWDAGMHECIQVGTAATMGELTTAARAVTFTVGGQALTAGRLVMVLEYTTDLN